MIELKPCEYCDGVRKPLQAENPDGTTYNTYDGIWFNEGKAYLNDADGCDIRIKYCPICGRKLEG